MAEPDPKRNILLYLAAEGVVPVLGGCAGALAGGPTGGLAGVAVGHAVEKAINLFGRGIVERWRAWFAAHPKDAIAAVAELAAVPVAEARAEARSIFLDLAPAADDLDLAMALEFVSAIPRAASRALVPAADGTRSLPATVALDDPRSLLQLLPEDMPPYPIPADLPHTPYRLVELLGAGGFGAVYRAVSPSLQHLPLAIKFCLDRSLLPSLHLERSNLERLMRAGGPGSAHVVRLYGYDLDHPTPYLVYEYVPGGDLTHLLAARRAALGRAPDAGEVLGWIAQIAEGLAFAHRAGLVHRDLKPANVLCNSECGIRNAEFKTEDPAGDSLHSEFPIPNSAFLKLADFGLGGASAARAAVRSRIGASTLDYLSLADQASLFRGAGTPLYMCPEQRRGNSPDPRHDLYALGVVWFQLLIGDVSRELHPGWAKELTAKFGVPAAHIALIERCIGWFEERPKNAGELILPLRNLGGQPVPVPPPEPAPVPAHQPDTAVNAAQITPVPSDTGRRRGAAATVARLAAAYTELTDMAKWRFETTVAYGFVLGLVVGLPTGFIFHEIWPTESMLIDLGRKSLDLRAAIVGTGVGLWVWAVYVWLIRSGVKAVAKDIEAKAAALVEELATDYPAEVAGWGGRAALRHPPTVRQLRDELDLLVRTRGEAASG